MVSFNPKDWGKAYEEKWPLYENFTNKLKILIEELLSTYKIDFAQIEYRTKPVDSFIEKIHREGKDYKDPLIEVTDLTGIRIIAYYKEDVDDIGKMIEKEFKIDKAHSVDKTQAIDPDRFGYLSIHYVVSLSLKRKKLAEWKQFSDLKAEIQVRTVLQHAWAAIDHKLRYKAPIEAPRSLRRQLYCLSALLELADNEFSSLRRRSDELFHQYSGDIDKGSYDIELNLASLDAYLESSKQHIKWMEIAEEIGFREILLEHLGKEEFPNEISRLFKILQASGITTIQDLDAILNEAKNWGKNILAKVYKISSEKGFIPYAVPYDILTFLTISGRKNRISKATILDTKYKTPLKEALLEIASKPKKKT